jgi:hypothetical protein
MFGILFQLCFDLCLGLRISHWVLQVSHGGQRSAGQKNRIYEDIGIIYKKEQFVFHLFSMQSILYLYNPYLPTQIRLSASERYHSPPDPRYT